jgi:glycosyltransferase involved in cell wall biosynthesis
MNPRVSVIMPAYNREKYIAESIQSVLGQSFADFELIILDDGSTDKTLEIARSFQGDQRIRVEQNRSNLGIAKTRNRGLELARADYVALLDSDDIWLDPDKLEKQIAFLDSHAGHAIVGGGIRLIATDGTKIKDVIFAESDSDIRKIILRANPFAQSSLMYRKNAILEAGGYSTDYQVADDYALWLAVGRRHLFADFPDLFTGYRIHGGNITRTKRLTTARETLEIVRANRAYYPNSSLGVAKAYLRLLIAYIRS